MAKLMKTVLDFTYAVCTTWKYLCFVYFQVRSLMWTVKIVKCAVNVSRLTLGACGAQTR